MGLKDWFKSKLFGGKVLRTLGAVKGTNVPMVGSELRVHVIEDKKHEASHKVGIAIVAKSALSYQMTPITLSLEESRRLIDMLQQAVQ
jgi:hypothetical protein